jgi:hypothetical protein
VAIPFADLPLARRVEAGWDRMAVENVLAQQRRSPGDGAVSLALGGGHAVFLGAGSPLSQAQGLGMSGPVAEDDLALLDRFFKERDTLTQIEVASLADPSLLPSLSLRGYLVAEQSHCLVSLLAGRAAREREQSVDARGQTEEVEVSPIGTDQLEEWVDVLMNSFFEEPEHAPPTLREGALAMAMIPTVTTWVARVAGQPAGGGSLMIQDGLALFCGDGTLPAFRGRGVHSSVIQARLSHALRADCNLAAICTQPGSGSQRNAERLGFRVAYARTMMVRH